jgi:hypothetical protein
MRTVSKLKKDSSWMENIELIQTSRDSGGVFVSL